jgi:hypothetical protein
MLEGGERGSASLSMFGLVVFQMTGYQSIAHLYIKASSLCPRGRAIG